MARVDSGLRTTALLAVGALVLHELRYMVGGGHSATGAGHGYLSLVVPLLALFAALAGGRFLAALARGGVRAGGPLARSGLRFARLWLAASAVLLLTYGAQELLEGGLAGGHAGGLEILFGSGGWSALPLAAAIGLVCAVTLRGAEAAIAGTAAGRALPRLRQAPRPLAPQVRLIPSASAVALELAGRSPPHLLASD